MNCVKELPAEYKLKLVLDMKDNKKLAVWMNIGALLLTILAIIVMYILRFGFVFSFEFDDILKLELTLLCFIVGMLFYMILHELVHGIVYKMLTHEKLTFGISLSCAFCGVPNVYVNKKTALLALMAPFTFFTIAFIQFIFIFDSYVSTLFILLFGLHFGGCIGDLFTFFLILFKFKGELLMNDTGPKQSFYVLEE